jgi:hypothetical protein
MGWLALLLLACDDASDRAARAIAFDAAGAPVQVSGRESVGTILGTNNGGARYFVGDPQLARPVYAEPGLAVTADGASSGPYAVAEVPATAAALPGPVFLGIDVRDPVSSGGVLLAEVFLKPPFAMPLDPCVTVEAGGLVLDDRPLLDGAATLQPGVASRPIVRHRSIGHVPSTFVAGNVPARVILYDCSDGAVLSSAAFELDVARSGLPDVDTLLPTGIIVPFDPGAAARGGTTRLRAGPDGLEPLELPLPPVRASDASALFVLGAVDPTVLASGGLDGIRATLTLAPGVVSWEGATSVRARLVWPEAPFARPRRAAIDALATLSESGVDSVLLGDPRVDDAGPEGRAETVERVAAAGLFTGDGVVHVPIARGPATRVVDRQRPTGPYAGPDPGVLDVVYAAGITLVDAYALVDAGAGVVIVEADGSSPASVDIYHGRPVIFGLPPLVDGVDGPTWGARLYVDAHGVSRVDLVGFVEQRGRVLRDDAGSVRPVLEGVSGRSAALGTDVRVGRMMAAIDVRAHAAPGPALPEAPALVPPPRSEVPALRPEWCSAGPPPEGARVTTLGGALEVTARVSDAAVTLGAPVWVDVWWRVVAPLPDDVSVTWSAVGPGDPWRHHGVPCEGTWPFDRWRVGDRVHERVVLAPPRGASAGPHEVSFVVRGGDTLLRPASGERRVTVGQVTVVGLAGAPVDAGG